MRDIAALFAFALSAGSASAQVSSSTSSDTVATEVSQEAPWRYSAGELTIDPSFRFATRAETARNLQLDSSGATADAAAILPLARVGAEAKYSTGDWRLAATYEHDLYADTVSVGEALPGEAPPLFGSRELALRRLGLRMTNSKVGSLFVGVDTPHWGLGMLTNDGDHGWTPGSARFVDLRGGDRYAQASFGTQLNTELNWTVGAAGALILDDDILLYDHELQDERYGADDRARQVAFVTKIGADDGLHGGAYYAHRWQDAEDGRELRVHAMDLTGGAKFRAFGAHISVEGEGIFLLGETNIAGSAPFPTQEVRQVAAAMRSSFDWGRAGAAFDAAFASGDRNLDDRFQSGFRFDPNYDMGLLMYRAAVAAQTSMSATRASNPDVLGEPAPGLERYPSRGSLTNTVAFFPRAFVRPMNSLEVYGGPLVAWTVTPLVDPLNTRVAGGTPRNARDAEPGSYLGTELDIGVRYTLEMAATTLQLGAEGGALFTGSALNGAGRNEVVYGGRAIVDWRL